MSDFQDVVQGLGMLGRVLALPRSAQYAQQSALAHRRMLEETGMDPRDIQAAYPDAPMQWLSPGEKPGIGGKILGGIGDVGALLSTIAGQPVGPPRMDISEVASASKLRKSFKEQQLTNRLAATETDPTAKILLETGNLETFGRYKAAQARGQGGGGMFGTSSLGARSRLAWLEQNQPDSPDIPALRRGIAEEDKRHPPAAPPLTPEQRINERVEADRRLAEQDHNRKVKGALDAGHKPGTDEYNRMVYGTIAAPPRQAPRRERTLADYRDEAWKAEVARAERDYDDPDPARAEANAQAAFKLAHPSPAEPTGEPAPAPAPAPGGPPARLPPSKAGTERPAGPPAAPSEEVGPREPLVGPTPQTGEQAAAAQQAARAQVRQLLVPPGGRGTPPSPATIAQNMPDLWAAAGLGGLEAMSPEELLSYVGTPQAGQGPQTEEAPPPTSSLHAQNGSWTFDPSKLSPAGRQQAEVIRGKARAGEFPADEARARLKALETQFPAQQ